MTLKPSYSQLVWTNLLVCPLRVALLLQRNTYLRLHFFVFFLHVLNFDLVGFSLMACIDSSAVPDNVPHKKMTLSIGL